MEKAIAKRDWLTLFFLRPTVRRAAMDRRCGIDRRQYAYAGHIPERRVRRRREGLDRRAGGAIHA